MRNDCEQSACHERRHCSLSTCTRCLPQIRANMVVLSSTSPPTLGVLPDFLAAHRAHANMHAGCAWRNMGHGQQLHGSHAGRAHLEPSSATLPTKQPHPCAAHKSHLYAARAPPAPASARVLPLPCSRVPALLASCCWGRPCSACLLVALLLVVALLLCSPSCLHMAGGWPGNFLWSRWWWLRGCCPIRRSCCTHTHSRHYGPKRWPARWHACCWC